MRDAGDDDTSQRAPPRPFPPKRQREGVVIPGKAMEFNPFAPASARLGERIAAGVVGGVAGAALALAAAWAFARPDLDPLARRVAVLEVRLQQADASDARLAALEAGANAAVARLDAAQAAFADGQARLAERIAAGERARAADTGALRDNLGATAAFDRRLSALESAAGALAPVAAEAHAARDAGAALDERLSALEGAAGSLAPVAAEARTARDLADKALAAAEAPKPDPRLAPLEADQAALSRQLAAGAVAQAALQSRLDKLEAADAAPKSVVRVNPTEPSDALDPRAPARAIAALALARDLAAGRPIGDALAALERLGESAAALAPLRPFAQTPAPSGAALAAAAPQLPAGKPSPSPGWARWIAEVQARGQVRKAGDVGFAQVERALAAGDYAQSLAAFDALPLDAQDAARDWRRGVEARAAADAAAEAIVARAIAALGAGR